MPRLSSSILPPPSRERAGSTELFGHPADAQGLQHKERQRCADPVKRDRQDENRHPAARGRLEDIPERNEQTSAQANVRPTGCLSALRPSTCNRTSVTR